MHSDGGVAKTDMAIREGMLQQRPTRASSRMMRMMQGLCQSSVFSNWRSASMDTAVTS
ncbi:unnamed protein product [Effrenium voratum]|nr:unnamed protein product [Effrenium voratum]